MTDLAQVARAIDAASDELALLNKLLQAKDEYRRLDALVETKPAGSERHIANMNACNALAKVLRVQREIDDRRFS